MKILKSSFILLPAFFLCFGGMAWAANKEEAIQSFAEGMVLLGQSQQQAEKTATESIDQLIVSMKDSQSAVQQSYDALRDRIKNLPKNDARQDAIVEKIDDPQSIKELFKEALQALGKDKGGTGVLLLDDFLKLDPEQHLTVEPGLGSTPPIALPSGSFSAAEEQAKVMLTEVNRILLVPARPGTVPEGDLIKDFIPQFVRQLFRFAWLAVFVSFVVSGIRLVTAFGNDERVEKAKRSIYYSLIGFAVVSLAFAIVRAVTEIDFFRLI